MSTIGLTNTGTKQEQLVIDAWEEKLMEMHVSRRSQEFPSNNVADVA
jgi:hypothetical protein